MGEDEESIATESCCGANSCRGESFDPRFRCALGIALGINAAMFVVEVVAGLDAGNYALSLAVLSMGLLWRARAALVKGLTMAGFGVFVLGKAGAGMPGSVRRRKPSPWA
jgi:hypothetical protein